MPTDEELRAMAEAYWQDDLAKFTPTWKEAPGGYKLMYIAGFRACEALYEERITAVEKLARRYNSIKSKVKPSKELIEAVSKKGTKNESKKRV